MNALCGGTNFEIRGEGDARGNDARAVFPHSENIYIHPRGSRNKIETRISKFKYVFAIMLPFFISLVLSEV